MPYSTKKPPKDLVKKIKKRHPKAGMNEVRQFIHVFNAAKKKGESEARAFAKAWGVLNENEKLKSSHEKTNKKETIKNIKKIERKEKRKKKKKSSLNVDKIISLSNYLRHLSQEKHACSVDNLLKEYENDN